MKRHLFSSIPAAQQFALVVALALALAHSSFGAESLKPRKSIKKPKTTAVDRISQFRDRISVKFQDD